MMWQSTGKKAAQVNTSLAMLQGLAEDGGLFMPTHIPQIHFDAKYDYPEFATQCLQPFFDKDPLADHLAKICKQAFNFPVPIHSLDEGHILLELFHGPTLAFKDFGARFLAACFEQLTTPAKQTLIMVATSGDTGSAVASAFFQKTNIKVVILYPEGKITPRQERQMTCWGENVSALAIQGNFDDCQQLVKAAFADNDITQRWHLSSANSINVGRLLPQCVYYAYTAVQLTARGLAPPAFIVPAGNLGNVTAAYMAKLMGAPIGNIFAVTNANRALTDYCENGVFTPRPSIPTLANAMDVGNPSNFVRLQALFPEFSQFQQQVHAISVSDNEIKSAIKDCYQRTKQIICPHTATAWHAAQQIEDEPCKVIVATAHPCKFEAIVEPLLKLTLPLPDTLQSMLTRTLQRSVHPATLEAVKQVLFQECNKNPY